MSVTAGERGVLERMGEGYWTTKQLAAALGRSYGSVHAMLVSLEKKGYVRSTSDGSAVSYTQTGVGAEAVQAPVPGIGPKRAEALEHHVKTVCGHPNPLHFCHSWFHWQVSSLAELTEAQGKELIVVATEQVAIARRQIAAEQERDRRRAHGEEVVYRG